MSNGMKAWLGLTAVSVALVTAWQLPVDSARLRVAGDRAPEIARHGELHQAVLATNEALQRVRWYDSLSALALAGHEDGLAVGGPPYATALVDDVRADLEGTRVRDDVVVGVFLQPNELGADPRQPLPTHRWNHEVMMGERDGRGLCLRVSSAPASELAGSPRASETEDAASRLGPCRLVAAHGMPGAHVRRWLEEGALQFAERTGEIDPGYSLRGTTRRGLFGIRTVAFIGADATLLGDRCTGGEAEACLELFLGPGWYGRTEGRIPGLVEATPVVGRTTSPFFAPFGVEQHYVFADLEDEFGPDAVGRFWRSGRPVPEAFEEAFGLPMGDWLVAWVDARRGVEPPGPALRAGAARGGILVIALSALLGGFFMRRSRRIV